MFVSSYQINNVLNVYSKQLSQDKGAPKPKAGNKKQLSDQIHLSTEGRRRATIEKVARDILSKIADYSAEGQLEIDERALSSDGRQNNIEYDRKKDTAFVFNVIDDLNQKTTTALSVKDTNFLINRLEQLAKDVVKKDAAN